ncbi:family 78 glycoside hydrolase catalytic domain [Aliiglaciecola sp. 3_MG-2023]|uniref:alpha-L-rhamnosidase n=1 Tax=Aliiglaciecola sp. 3_MG-2023 TaxID=3062644 RepID=UPI0026E2ACF8|nr:alpha-L-rhamnosidase [Aliiglaciecola sp. 3_MG-2023]MDO6693310.1 family 78 glycoside hydrolase catalytic domain [Aliiglaciecola sp. 3_MG-2023]
MIKHFLLLSLLGLVACINIPNGTNKPGFPSTLLVEGLTFPMNVHTARPRLSWHANVNTQDAYQVQVASSKELLSAGIPDLWDSGKVASRHSRNIGYQGKKLNTNDTAYWRVRVWPSSGDKALNWSPMSRWQMGLLDSSDWQAKWIQIETQQSVKSDSAVSQWVNLVGTVENEDGSVGTPALEQLHNMPTAGLFRYEFSLEKTVVSAKLHSTAAGYYEVFINGKRVKDRIMDPGQTDFDKRILYNTDQVTDFIGSGNNVIAVHLGSGWYDEDIAFSGWKDPDNTGSNPSRKTYSFGQPSFIAQLELEFSDGSKKIVSSNENWLTHASPIVKEGIFSGELFDGNKIVKGWKHKTKETNDPQDVKQKWALWKPAKVLDSWPTKQLEPQLLPPIRPVKKLQPKQILTPKDNVWVFDFGQNFTGIPSLHLNKMSLKQGQAVYLRFAEWADDKGNISQLSGGGWATNLNAVDGYIAGKENPAKWTPSFTWHGFRYVEITGLDEKPFLDILSAQLVRSDVDRVGLFSSSDPLLNRIHHTALWSYESNLMSVPLDCPIREKAGWTGDAHATLVTANYNFNMETFWPKYLGDFRTALKVAPTVVPGKRTGGGKVDWAVAEVLIAWEHYRHHGDIQLLEKQYQSLLEYMDFGQRQMSDFLIHSGYGDWCDPVASPGTPRIGGRGTPQWTSTTVTSTALFTQAANYMSKISQVLGKQAASEQYQALYQNLRKGFHTALYDLKTGHYGSQTADAMALRFGITPIELRQSVADALNKDVLEKWQGHSSVGALGQTYLYLALSDYGYADTAFNIFKAKGYPGFSYLFDELNGTTLWERKGAFDPSKGRGPIRSLNHPFHGGYDGWFYQGLGGIRPLENTVGYQTFALRPVFPKKLDSIKVSYTTGYGEIKSRWKRAGKQIIWHFTIPNNSRAYVTLPNQETKLYRAGEFSLGYTQSD